MSRSVRAVLWVGVTALLLSLAGQSVAASTVAVRGELLWDDIEGGVWSLRDGGQLYDLHGDIPLKDGDWAEATGILNESAFCVHMRGKVLNVKWIEKVEIPPNPAGWKMFERSLVFFDEDGKSKKNLRHINRKNFGYFDNDLKDDARPPYISAGVLSQGRAAWAIFADHTFQFFDEHGKPAWKKPDAALAVFSEHPAALLLAARVPGCPRHKAIEDCDMYAVLYSTSGQVLLSFEEAPLLDRDSLYLTPTGRFGFVKVYKTIDGVIFFDAATKKKKVYAGLGLPKIDDDGVYRILGKTGELSAVKEIYLGTLASD